MTALWPAALGVADPAISRRRFAIAQEALIRRARPGTFFYCALALGYALIVLDRPLDLTVALTASGVLFVLGLVRLAFYRASARFASHPERWRWTHALLAGAMLLVWDCLTAFELWHGAFDPASSVLLAASLALRATSTYTSCPDLRVFRVALRWTRLPILVAPLLVGTGVGIVTCSLLLAHALYSEAHCKQLHEEFWRSIVAAETAVIAHENLQREVAMRERAEVELRLAQKLESVGRLAAGIAHEINSPLQAMMTNLEFVSDSVDELLAIARAAADPVKADELDYLGENLPSALAGTRASLERTAAIVRSVKTFADPDGASTSRVDINGALASTLEISRNEYASIADIQTAFGELPLVECYPGELNLALLGIVTNAAHAIGETGRRGVITVSTSVERGAVQIEIADTGNGIPQAIHERIFDPFFTTKEVGRGTGQGLAIARSVIANRHHGELTFRSELGLGTTFVIRLPVAA
jgi:signal transduction histidine kinase